MKRTSLLDEILDSEEFGKWGENKPIIIVPASASPGNLCLLNAIQFLKDGKYVNGEDLQTEARMRESHKESVTFEKRVNDRRVTFEVYDSVTSFTKLQWKRVVAVFAAGPSWQFKDWPKNETIVDIMLKVRGFYLHFSDFAVPEYIKSLNVKILYLKQFHRHEDKSVYNEFWKELSLFLSKERFRPKQRS